MRHCQGFSLSLHVYASWHSYEQNMHCSPMRECLSTDYVLLTQSDLSFKTMNRVLLRWDSCEFSIGCHYYINIESSLWQMKSLKTLDLHQNTFSGSMPKGVGADSLQATQNYNSAANRIHAPTKALIAFSVCRKGISLCNLALQFSMSFNHYFLCIVI